MHTYRLRYEFYVQHSAVIEVKAGNMAEAATIAGRLDPRDGKHAPYWSADDEATDIRLYSITDANDEDSYITVNVPNSISHHSWIHIDLHEQLRNAMKPGPTDKQTRRLDRAIARYMSDLTPEMTSSARTSFVR